MRYFQALCGALLLVPALAHASVDNGLLALAPPETLLLTGVDVSRTTASPFGQYLLTRINTEDTHFTQMIADTGFDPRRDLQQILFVGLSKPGASNSRFAILARGSFDPARIAAGAQKHGAKVTTDANGNTVYVQDNKGQSFAFAFPDGGLAVMGDPASVQQILVLAHSANATALDPQLVQFANQVGGSNDFWFATLMSGAFLGSNSPAPEFKNTPALQSILQSAGGIQFGSTVNMVLDASTRSAQDATSLADVLRFVGNLIQMQAGNDPRSAIAAEALQNMQVQTNGANVHATVAITEEKLEQLTRPSSAAKVGR
jgi:hypothetical protein